MDGSFEPELIKKGQTRIDGMDDKIIGLYAAGLSTRDIRAHLEEVYGLKVSADLPSHRCMQRLPILSAASQMPFWRKYQTGRTGLWSRCIPLFSLMLFGSKSAMPRTGALESRQVKNQAVYVALGVNAEGEREVLGLWIANNEGARFWLSVMNNLRNPIVKDILIEVVLLFRTAFQLC